jgi:hypothetical protein
MSFMLIRTRKRLHLHPLFESAVAAGVLLLAATVAQANSYSIVQPPTGGEATQLEIIEQIYGGTFIQSGVDFSNGVVTLMRVWDQHDISNTIDLLLGDPATGADQVWTDGIANVTAQAKYAALGQSFGWNTSGTTGAGYVELLTEADIGGASVQINVTGDMLWGVNPSSGDFFWSKDSENGDGFDHLITYKVLGLGVADTVWLQFWEDLPVVTSDFDYNDFVIEIRAIPEPSTVLLVAAGMVAIGIRARRHENS